MPNLSKLLSNFNPDPNKAGNILLYLNVISMVLAGLSNTCAAAIDKNTSAEDKKFLIPAGLFTGVANIAVYYTLTTKIINGLKSCADKAISKMSPDKLQSDSFEMVAKKIKKAEGGFLGTGLFKNDQYISSMKSTLIENGKATPEAISLYKNNIKAGAGVLGAFAGAVIGCSILTPIIRDVSAYFVQKYMENKNPELMDKPFKPYFDPSHFKVSVYQNVPKQPLTMKNYMAFTSGNMKV